MHRRPHVPAFFDGKTSAARVNMYASAPAPATITQLADELEGSYGMEVPLVDSVSVGTPGSKAAKNHGRDGHRETVDE